MLCRVTELVVECGSSAYMTDTKLSRLKRIPAEGELIGPEVNEGLLTRVAETVLAEAALAAPECLQAASGQDTEPAGTRNTHGRGDSRRLRGQQACVW